MYTRPYPLTFLTRDWLAFRPINININVSRSRGTPDGVNGQANDKCGSAFFAVAAGFHRPTVVFYDMFDDKKAQPQPTEFSPSTAIGLSETVEAVREQARLNTLPIIADRDARLRLFAIQHELHASTRGREFHCIGQQIPDDLLNPDFVAIRRADARINSSRHLDLLGICSGSHDLNRGLDNCSKLARIDLEL
jgi:hypothetical protein